MIRTTTKDLLRPWIPRPLRRAYSTTREGLYKARLRVAQARDRWAITSLQYRELGTLQFAERRRLVRRLASVNADVFCAHKHAEMAEMVTAMLALPAATPGCVVEAGCFKGGSTVKLSVVAKLVGRRLVVFDSFEGLPKHGEDHGRTIFGEQTGFVPGLYAGALEEVTDNVRRFGEIDVCEFRKGWFDDTMPKFSEPIAAAFLDVDLAASTRTCLAYLYPLLVPGGVIFSHDGHLPLCMAVFRDASLWREIGGPPPVFSGLGTRKLISIMKPQ